ncbi:uncharacterized protein LOC127879546 [Dreissena polymorpha]|uniref:uncharacterized protein LOC127879546 n=1 Tax=Dreissena polymorpha TaxID=45954 RepID=UPI0022641172|nr:uncharacterized protein LOC127879546 [Dreissena polymorpha]
MRTTTAIFRIKRQSKYFNKMRRKTKLNLHRVKSRRSKCGYADMTRELLQLVAIDDVNARKTLLPQKKFINTKISNKSAHLCMTPSRTNKRKLTPLKSPIKTPFKSPIYKARAIDHLYTVRDDRINIICWRSLRIYHQSVTRTVRHASLDSEQSLLILRSKTISLIIEKGVRRKAGPLIWTETLYKKAPLVLGGKKLEEMIPKCWLLLKWA